MNERDNMGDGDGLDCKKKKTVRSIRFGVKEEKL